MGQADFLELGSWNARCSMCNFKFKSNQLTKNWQGMMRCYRCQESRQPQDFVRAIPDIQTPPWTQPQSSDDFIAGALICTENSDQDDLDPVYYISSENLYPLSTES